MRAAKVLFIALSIPFYNLFAAFVENVESEDGTAVLNMTDNDVTISSSTRLKYGEIRTDGKVIIKEYDDSVQENVATVTMRHEEPTSSSCNISSSSIKDQDHEEDKRILGTELFCNYDLYEYRNCPTRTEIKGNIRFTHRETKKIMVTEFSGIAFGDTSRQKSGQVLGKNVQQAKLKTINNFQELMTWIKGIEATLGQ